MVMEFADSRASLAGAVIQADPVAGSFAAWTMDALGDAIVALAFQQPVRTSGK